ncbi:Rhodopsin domain-containing protein [Madurella fahalii]|uniref:Rhodopsin domain-containing protein n=1 Tax=Madurella fahalii TaxID=1157608 RepID=A0ABQ0GQ71_9PEZI
MASAAALPPYAFEDRSATVIGVVVFCLVWATSMVGLRLWTRWKIIKQVGLDDYACVSGLLMTYGSGIAIAHMTKYGLGKHVFVMPLQNIPLYLRDFYVSIVMYCASLLAIKLTFLFQYYRVLAVQHMRVVYIVGIVIVGGWALSQVLVGIFICSPIDGFWDSTVQSTCIPNIPQWYINAAGNIITDIAVFALPLPALWKLHLPRSQKLVLLGIFSLGFFTVIISIIRIRYLKLFEDFPWENVDSSLWSIGELTSALTCACLPTLRPLVVRFFPSLGSQASQSSTGQSNSSWHAKRQGVGKGYAMDLESAGCRTHSSRIPEDGSLSVHGSEIELEKHADPFGMHIVRKLNGESGSVGSAGFGSGGYALPASPGKAHGKWSVGRL